MKKWILQKLWNLKERYHRATTWAFNPNRLLRLMLIVLLAVFALFVLLEKGKFDHFGLAPYKFGMDQTAWVPATGIFLAAAGWIITSIVTIRNSVKQHTINTLLQTRLSATYQEQSMKVRAGLNGHTPENPAPLALIKATLETKVAVEYILNYVEFMAVGIRHGDLHEEVLKDSMRGIVLRFTKITQEYIDECRVDSPRTYQNLIWLRKRWRERFVVAGPASATAPVVAGPASATAPVVAVADSDSPKQS